MKRVTQLFVALGLVLATAGTAVGDKTFRFIGGGHGHGIGLSQYGAFGLAKRGWGADRILRYYYSGSQLETREPPAQAFRIGLLQGREEVTLRAARGTFDMVLAGGTIHSVPEGGTRRVVIAGGAYRIFQGEQKVAEGGGPDDNLRIVRAEAGVVRIGEWGHAIGHGELVFKIVSEKKAHLVAKLPPEEYLLGIAEVPASWPQAALRAQAVAARTYAYRKVASNPGQTQAGCACALYSTIRDQHYTGWDKEISAGAGRWIAAVQATAKQVATFGGSLISTFYSSSSGGWTENVEKVWGGQAQPYLRGKCDPGDYTQSNPNRTWDASIAATTIATKLRRALGWDLATVGRIRVITRGVSGRVVEAIVRGRSSGGARVSLAADGDELRRALGLKSTRFWVNHNLNVTGAIRSRYDAMGCKPGLPRTGQRAQAGGVWQAFAKGRMYFKEGLGRARWLRGPVQKKYLAKKGPRGPLGFPISDVRRINGGRDRARFQHGVITCKRSTGVCRIRRG